MQIIKFEKCGEMVEEPRFDVIQVEHVCLQLSTSHGHSYEISTTGLILLSSHVYK
jgi:hypothetical protein